MAGMIYLTLLITLDFDMVEKVAKIFCLGLCQDFDHILNHESSQGMYTVHLD